MWFLFVNSQEGYTVTLLCKENDTFHTKLFLYTFCADEKKSKYYGTKCILKIKCLVLLAQNLSTSVIHYMEAKSRVFLQM